MKVINRIAFCLLIVICILTTISIFNFGYGLGNVIYIFPVILLTTLHFFITRRVELKNDDNYWTISVFCVRVLCIGIVYKTTIGRGPEFSWNGKIFFIK